MTFNPLVLVTAIQQLKSLGVRALQRHRRDAVLIPVASMSTRERNEAAGWTTSSALWARLYICLAQQHIRG